MANKNPKDRTEKIEENIEQTASSTQEFFTKYGKTIVIAVAAVLVLGLGILAYQKFVYQPKCREAREQAFPAEQSFAAGEYEIALQGDGNNLGFADIIDNYGSKAGKAVYLYAGVCELQLGNFESALGYLSKYNGKEPILQARAKACEGDAHVGLGNYAKAASCFEAAAAVAENVFAASYLLKAGIAYEALGDKASALKSYNTIKDKYTQSIEAYDINKYIARVAE